MATKAILNGHLSVVGSKHISPAAKASLLATPEGQVRVLTTTLYHKDGTPVVLQGKMRLSGKPGDEKRGLTCSVTVQNLEVSAFLRDENEKGKKAEMTDAQKAKLADSLLG